MSNGSAIALLKAHLVELKEIEEFSSIEDKAIHIGEINRIDSSIQLLELCSKHKIVPGALVSTLPDTDDIHFQYLVVHENESSMPKNWEEVLFDDLQIRFSSGDLIIRV